MSKKARNRILRNNISEAEAVIKKCSELMKKYPANSVCWRHYQTKINAARLKLENSKYALTGE